MIYHDIDPKGLTRIRSIKNAHFFSPNSKRAEKSKTNRNVEIERGNTSSKKECSFDAPGIYISTYPP